MKGIQRECESSKIFTKKRRSEKAAKFLLLSEHFGDPIEAGVFSTNKNGTSKRNRVFWKSEESVLQ